MQKLWEAMQSKPNNNSKSSTLPAAKRRKSVTFSPDTLISKKAIKKSDTLHIFQQREETNLKNTTIFEVAGALYECETSDDVNFDHFCKIKPVIETHLFNIIKMLCENSKLRDVKISTIAERSMATVIEALSDRPQIKLQVDLSYRALEAKNADAFQEILDPNANIVSLNLAGTLPDEKMWSIILDYLRTNKTLRCLDLSHNNLTDIHIASLCETLNNNSLIQLNLGQNTFGLAGLGYIDQLIKNSPNLISMPGINTYSISLLGDGATGKTSLIHGYVFGSQKIAFIIPTIFDEYHISVKVEESIYILKIKDSSGSESYFPILSGLLKSDAYILCFSEGNSNSLENISAWEQRLRYLDPTPKPTLLASTQSKTKTVSEDDIKRTLSQTEIQNHCSCSISEKNSIESMFKKAIEPFTSRDVDNNEDLKFVEPLERLRQSLTANYTRNQYDLNINTGIGILVSAQETSNGISNNGTLLKTINTNSDLLNNNSNQPDSDSEELSDQDNNNYYQP